MTNVVMILTARLHPGVPSTYGGDEKQWSVLKWRTWHKDT